MQYIREGSETVFDNTSLEPNECSADSTRGWFLRGWGMVHRLSIAPVGLFHPPKRLSSLFLVSQPLNGTPRLNRQLGQWVRFNHIKIIVPAATPNYSLSTMFALTRRHTSEPLCSCVSIASERRSF